MFPGYSRETNKMGMKAELLGQSYFHSQNHLNSYLLSLIFYLLSFN